MFGKKNSENQQLIKIENTGKVEKIAKKSQNVAFETSSLHSTEVADTHEEIKQATSSFLNKKLETPDYISARNKILEILMERVDSAAIETLDKETKKRRIIDLVSDIIANEIRIPLTAAQVVLLKEQAIDNLLGFGPLEVLIADPDVSDIMVNGCKTIFVEKYGKLVLTDVTFNNEKHLLNTIQKIVSLIGRRVDESSPMVDARMPDGSRFNAIIPPLALDGSLISIRKFRKSKIKLKEYLDFGSMTPEMANFLAICGAIRLNIIISGGTGSGKTTLLNAISGNIAHSERVVTIEDAAELQLQQPHVLRLETRPPNMQGVGEITARQLVKNALRMRPDRIIIGEIRGDEVIDVLSAMNTGHDGSMATIHSNTPRDALSRIENLVGMSGIKLSNESLRSQISSAVHLIVQVARQRDGKRRITYIDEVLGVSETGDLMTGSLFGFKPGEMGDDGILRGEFFCTGRIPEFIEQAAYFGREAEMRACLQPTK